MKYLQGENKEEMQEFLDDVHNQWADAMHGEGYEKDSEGGVVGKQKGISNYTAPHTTCFDTVKTKVDGTGHWCLNPSEFFKESKESIRNAIPSHEQYASLSLVDVVPAEWIYTAEEIASGAVEV